MEKSKILRFFKPPRKLKFTREGKYFLGITLGVGFAAINTGNNLLYLLLGMLLSLIAISGIMSEYSLRDLTVVRRLPIRAQVGKPHLVEIEVFNHKKKMPSYAIEIEDLREGQPADKRCFFLKISPQSAQVAAYRRTPTKRGLDKHTGFRIATRFPFGLFEKSREIMTPGEIIVYPAVDAVRLPKERPGTHDGTASTYHRGHGDEILSLRLMREGDDPRDIYWKRSTMLGQRILRERASEARPHIELTIDNIKNKKVSPSLYEQVFEQRIREIASMAVAHIKRGDAVIIKSTSGETTRANKNTGSDVLLKFLALLQTQPEAS